MKLPSSEWSKSHTDPHHNIISNKMEIFEEVDIVLCCLDIEHLLLLLGISWFCSHLMLSMMCSFAILSLCGGAAMDIGVRVCGWMRASVWWCSIPPLPISPPSESLQIDGGNEDTCYKGCMVSCLSYVTFASFEDVSVKGLPFSAEPRSPTSHLESASAGHIILKRLHTSTFKISRWTSAFARVH